MWLPAPTTEGVNEFSALVKAEFGVELEPSEALELATRVLQIHLIKLYESSDLRKEIL